MMKRNRRKSLVLLASLLIVLFSSFGILTIHSQAKGENLPDGFLPLDELPEDIFSIANGDGMQPYTYSKIDGIYMQLEYIYTSNGPIGVDYGVLNPDWPNLQYLDYFQSLSSKPYVTILDGETTPGFSVSGDMTYKYNFPGGEGAAFQAGDTYDIQTHMDITFDSFRYNMEESFNIYSNISGTCTLGTGSNGDLTYDTFDLGKENEYQRYHISEDGTLYLTYPLENGRGELYFKVLGMKPKKTGSVSVFQNAKESSGEDSGVSVPAAIGIGIMATGTAVGGALLAGANSATGNTNGPKDDNNPKTPSGFKMFVQKDFGDSVRRGGKPVIVRARMAEIDPGGTILDRNDLTAKIVVSSNDFKVQSASAIGRYCEATVSVPNDFTANEATLTFTFTGLTGSFSNNVIFRIVDEPSLKFISDRISHRGNDSISVNCIYGDGFTYTDYFKIEDTSNPPALKDFKVVKSNNYDVTFELTEKPSEYKILIKNKTQALANTDIFKKPVEEDLEFQVMAEGESEPIKGYVYMQQYPEGLTVQSRYQENKKDVEYVRVQAYEKSYYGELDNKWQVSELVFTLAVKDSNTSIIDPEGTEYIFGHIKGGGGLGTRADKEESIAKKFKYKEEKSIFNDKFTYTFEPNSTLCEPDDDSFYIVLLPASCNYKGKKYEIDVPLRLCGLEPDPMEGWDEEYKKLRDRIEKFSLPNEKDIWLEKLELIAIDPKSSTEQLRLLSKYIVRQYMRYWTVEGIASVNDAELYDKIVYQLEWLKFIGDCAFSFLVSAYAGPVAEALISPAKDYITESIGELIGCWNQGTEIKLENFSIAKTLESAGDNLVSNNISLTSWKQAATTLSAYFVYSSIKNYLKIWREKGESNLWGAFVDGFSDMTAQGLKAAAGELFGRWIKNNKKFQKYVGRKITYHFNKYFGKGRTINLKEQTISNLQYDLNNALGFEGELRNLAGFQGESNKVKILKIEIIEKYLTELVGEYGGYVNEFFDEQLDSEGTFAFGDDGHLLFKFSLTFLEEKEKFLITIDFNKIAFYAATGIFGIIWEELFGQIPCATSVIQVPKDPPLPPAKK